MLGEIVFNMCWGEVGEWVWLVIGFILMGELVVFLLFVMEIIGEVIVVGMCLFDDDVCGIVDFVEKSWWIDWWVI